MFSVSELACAWGDEGHAIVGHIADHYLTPTARTKVNQILRTDLSHLTPTTDIATESTWADRFRDSDRDTTKVHYTQTHQWHFADIELDAGDIDAACFGHPALPSGTPASLGPVDDCVTDKIDDFSRELKDPSTSPDEKREALQFLLHFVGDVHQPLHSSDDHDKGGNDKEVSAKGIEANNLHHYWDTEFVQILGSNPKQVGDNLIAKITRANLTAWRKGTAAEWTLEAFAVSKSKAYGPLPSPDSRGSYKLSATYVKSATKAASTQLSKAGVRLATVLNAALQ